MNFDNYNFIVQQNCDFVGNSHFQRYRAEPDPRFPERGFICIKVYKGVGVRFADSI